MKMKPSKSNSAGGGRAAATLGWAVGGVIAAASFAAFLAFLSLPARAQEKLISDEINTVIPHAP